MGRRYLWPHLGDALHQLTSIQILGKIFIGSVFNPASAKLSTWGAPFTPDTKVELSKPIEQ